MESKLPASCTFYSLLVPAPYILVVASLHLWCKRLCNVAIFSFSSQLLPPSIYCFLLSLLPPPVDLPPPSRPPLFLGQDARYLSLFFTNIYQSSQVGVQGQRGSFLELTNKLWNTQNFFFLFFFTECWIGKLLLHR